MKIKLNQIRIGEFEVREEMDKGYFEELKDSLKRDGQWNPVIVRPSDEKRYELISGHTRVKAAKELGWKEIDATVRDLSDEEAEFLALKTNLVRAGLSEIDEGRVIKKIIDEFQLTQTDIAKRLGKSRTWVGKRLSLVLKVVEEVQEALSKGSITPEHASLIAQISEERFDDWEEKQREFLRVIIKSKWSRDETRIQLKRFFNTTLCTIGYEGRELEDFIDILKENDVVVLVDVRHSAESKHKPDFNGRILERALKQNSIAYEHHPELGIPYELQEPYKAGGFDFKCLDQWYKWNVKTNADLSGFVERLKDLGKPAIMCMERYAKSQKGQKYHCHRHILANLVKETLLFPERVDL